MTFYVQAGSRTLIKNVIVLWFLFTELCSLLLRKSFALLHNVNLLNLCSGLVRKVKKTQIYTLNTV